MERTWQRKCITPRPGVIYRNRGGGQYRCMGALSNHSAIMKRVTDQWTLVAHGVQEYPDGTIEWDYSTGGHWPRTETTRKEL